VLTDRQRDVLALFRDGEHLAVFSDGGDLERRLREFLDDAAARRRIAAAGRREVLRRHTYVHRIAELLKSLEGAGRPPAPASAPA